MKGRRIFLVDTGYACAGVLVWNGRVDHAAPIFRWMVGKPWGACRAWSKIRRVIELKRENLHENYTEGRKTQ